MHSIPNERALSHWRALSQLPAHVFDDLKARFLREQPLLVAGVLQLNDGLVIGPDGTETVPTADDPRYAGVMRLVGYGAILAEILHREAGRPLRQLDHGDVLEIVRAHADLLAGLNAGDGNTQNIFTTCLQRDLLTGVTITQFSDETISREELATETLAVWIFIEGLHRACGDGVATSPRDWDAERVVFALSSEGDPLRREALAACDRFRAELVPRFIEELEWRASKPKVAKEEDVSLLMHAAFQLAQWREDSAWPAFRKLFSLPGSLCYDLLGDMITQDGSVLLAMVGGRRRDELRAMIMDESLDEFCRGACVDALTCLVAWDEMPKEEFVSHLRGLLAAGTPEHLRNQHVVTAVAAAVCDMEAWELMPEVEAAFDRGAIDEGYIDMACFRDSKAGRFGSQCDLFRRNHPPVTDVADTTSWLDQTSLRDEPPPAPLPPYEDRRPVSDSFRPYIAPEKVGRNEPCPCGSGKKYKKCCGN